MGLRITLLGTGVGIPQPGRSQAAILLESQGPLLFDCGAGTLLRLGRTGIDMHDVDIVVLTHLHLDHVSDLLALANARYLQQLSGLEVYGPAGTELWFERLQGAFPNLADMQVFLHELRPLDCISLKGCDIFAEEAKHSVTALAYRIEGQDKTVVYSGDTEPYRRIAALAEGADLLIHECSFPEPFDVTNHTTPKKLGSIVKDAGRIVLTHFYPQAEGHTEEMAREVSDLSGLPVVAGWDLMTMVV
jgi:ribonuclease BN (tRNA processing enzyme)